MTTWKSTKQVVPTFESPRGILGKRDLNFLPSLLAPHCHEENCVLLKVHEENLKKKLYCMGKELNASTFIRAIRNIMLSGCDGSLEIVPTQE